MTLAWAAIIITILIILERRKLFGRALLVSAILGGVLILGTVTASLIEDYQSRKHQQGTSPTMTDLQGNTVPVPEGAQIVPLQDVPILYLDLGNGHTATLDTKIGNLPDTLKAYPHARLLAGCQIDSPKTEGLISDPAFKAFSFEEKRDILKEFFLKVPALSAQCKVFADKESQ